MQLKEFNILLDIKKYNKTDYFEVVQGDLNSNVLNITLVDGLNPYNFAGANVEIVFAKPDGTTVIQDNSNGVVVINELEGKIQCTLNTNTTASPGRVIAEARVSEGEILLTSARFGFYVRRAIFGDDTIKSTNEWPLLKKLLEVSESEKLRETEELIRQSNEEERIQNEQTREDNELSRNINEEQRIVKETDRINSENERIANEEIRRTNEQNRQSNEVTRIENEDIRISQEESRVLAEELRESNETIRQQNENERESNEVIRVSNEEERIQNESNRVLAETDRVQAELDRQEGYNQAINDFNTQGQQAINDFNTQGQRAINDFVTETERVEAIYPTRLTNVENDLAQHKLDYASQRQQDQLKLAKVEKDINDYKSVMAQVNINQEATQKVSGYSILSLPKNAANGQVSATVKGLTATNLVKNGDFSNDTKWFSVGLCKIKITDGDLELYDANGVEPNVRSVSCYGKAGDKIYITAIAKPSSETTNISIKYRDINANITIKSRYFTIDNDTEVFLSDVITLPSDSYSGGPQVVFGHSDTPTESCFIKSKSMMAINLTETFGAGNEPTVEECDEIFANWFDGIKSTVSAMRLKSVSEDESEVSTAYVVAKDEQGKIAELRSLPNGVKDEVRVSDGKLIKRVSDEVVLDGNLQWDLNNKTEQSTVLVLSTDKVVEILPDIRWYGIIIGQNTDMEFSSLLPGGSVGRVVTTTVGLFIALPVPNGTLEEAKNYLNSKPVTLTYQLAESKILPVEVSGSIVSHPNGTIYIDPATTVAGVYGENGIAVTEAELGIKELEKISKIDFETGLGTELDVSTAAIAEDGLSFTHPNLVYGDIVFFEYIHNYEGTEGEAIVEYYDSRYVIKDSVTGKFYKWNVSVSDGVPTISVVEV